LTEYNPFDEWTKDIINQKGVAFPSEYVIRIFKGNYPNLNFTKSKLVGKNICDVGCGDGRNYDLLLKCGFQLYGTEITQEIVDKVNHNLKNRQINAEIKVGTNQSIPFQNNFFDFLLSWNSCYYMGKTENFEDYVKEYARILKKDGYLILSIPKKTCFIFENSENIKPGYVIIKNDPFKIRNGEIMRIFANEDEIRQEFSKYFKNFIFASIHDDCFGLNYHWHIIICQKD